MFNVDAISEGIFNKLTGDVPLMNLITGAFHLTAPDGQVYPYITYRMVMAFPEDRFDQYYTRNTWQFDCWAKDVDGSTTAGSEASLISDALITCLDGALDIVVPGYSFIYSKRDMVQAVEEFDVEAVRILVQYRFLVGIAK